MSSSELRQERYTLICLATLLSRAAIRGGLSAEIAFSLSDIYCQRADILDDPKSIQLLEYSMMVDFCEKVHTVCANQDLSSVVQKCIDYISIHLHESISLNLLSAHCGLCTRSLSLRFRAETGFAIPDYIHREKIKEAQFLLRHTEYSLSEIAVFLNYSSQSYFIVWFKKICGITPKYYREHTGGLLRESGIRKPTPRTAQIR